MTRVLGAVALTAVFCGCESQQQMVDEMQSDATQVAKQRGRFELNCPTATASVLSKEMIQSDITNPRWAPPQRAEYTVGVSGCDKRATYWSSAQKVARDASPPARRTWCKIEPRRLSLAA
jgi:hypothetical protein